MPQPMAGSASHGAADVRNAFELLQRALPTLPMGSELWQAVHKAIGEIGKNIDIAGGKDNAAGVQSLMGAMRDMRTDPSKRAAFMAATGGPGGGAAPMMPGGAGGGSPMGMPGM